MVFTSVVRDFLVLLRSSMHPPRLRILGGDVEADVHGGVDDLEPHVFEAQQVQAGEISGK